MKHIIVTVLLASLVCASRAQVADSLFIVTYTTGPTWDSSKAPNDQPYFKEHSARLSQLRKEGSIKLGARYADRGIIFIAARNLAHAQQIIGDDVAVKQQLFLADVQRLSVFYYGCLEKPK